MSFESKTKTSDICCTRCGQLFPSKEIFSFEGFPFCGNCFDEATTICDECNLVVFREDLRCMGDVCCCPACYYELFRMCEGCGETIRVEDCFYDDTGYCICETCYDNLSSEYELNSADYQPSWKYYKIEKESIKTNSLFYGIELEVECDDNRLDILQELPSFVYGKSDGSLSCDNGLEIVSHPATYKWLKENTKEWEKILNFRKRGVTSYDNTSCGIHIHMSKNAFTSDHLYKFLLLFYKNPDFILTISQRPNKSHLDSWATITNDAENLRIKARDKYGGKRYTAVNLQPFDTIEVRIFKGTLNPESFWKNVEFCEAAYKFTKRNLELDIRLPTFISYVCRSKKKYPNLYQFLKKKGLL